MILRTVAIALLLSLACFAAKWSEVTFSGPAVAGTVQLAPGHYKVELRGTSVAFTPFDSNKTQTTEAKVETETAKYDQTTLVTSQEGNVTHVRSIGIGGTKTRLNFE
jgi:cytochrome c556